MKRQTLQDLKKIMAQLRSPEGCPWDRQQTPQSLTPFAVEEALELEDAIHFKTPQDVKEELGDLLFQVVFQAQMAEEQGLFNLDDVIHDLSQKMIERHPHVFSSEKEQLSDIGVSHRWEKNKSLKTPSLALFQMPKNFPSLLSAVKIGKKTRTINFDWQKTSEVFKQFLSEVSELKSALRKKDKSNQEEEIGDALFTLAQVARFLQIDPEKALRLANKKVVRRIEIAYQISGKTWKEYCALSVEEKEALWTKAKKFLKKKK
jgi:tetrapyrrole methylase family protein/MazG family protein